MFFIKKYDINQQKSVMEQTNTNKQRVNTVRYRRGLIKESSTIEFLRYAKINRFFYEGKDV